MDPHNRPQNDKWDTPDTHDGEYPPDWTARCLNAFEANDHTCQNCGWKSTSETDPTDKRLYGKHIIPPEGGGTNVISNIAVVCSDCYTPEPNTNTDTPDTPVTEGDSTPDPKEDAHPRTPEVSGERSPGTTESNISIRKYNRDKFSETFAQYDIFPGTPDENGQYTLYQSVLRLGLLASTLAIAVMFFYQILIAIQTTLSDVTTTYTIPTYVLLITVPWALAWFLDYKVGPEYLTDDDTPSTHYHSIKIMTIIMVSTLAIYYALQPILPAANTPHSAYRILTIGILTTIYTLAGIGALITLISGTLESRHGLNFPLRPTLWIGTLIMIPTLHLWTWLFLGNPHTPTDPIIFTLPAQALEFTDILPITDTTTLSRGTFLDALTIAFPVVAIAYLVRIRHIIQTRLKHTETPPEGESN